MRCSQRCTIYLWILASDNHEGSAFPLQLQNVRVIDRLDDLVFKCLAHIHCIVEDAIFFVLVLLKLLVKGACCVVGDDKRHRSSWKGLRRCRNVGVQRVLHDHSQVSVGAASERCWGKCGVFIEGSCNLR